MSLAYLEAVEAPQRVTDTGLTIQEDIISDWRRNRPGRDTNPGAYITIHETGNADKGADAAAHGAYLDSDAGERDMVSWHYTVDDHAIVQHLPDYETAYGIKTGYIVGPTDLIETLERLIVVDETFVSSLGQYILNEYIERGYYQTHIGHLVKHYAHKRDLLCQCLDGIADKGITYTKPRGGLLLWCDLEERINERRLYHEAESRGLLIMPGFLFYPKGYEGGGHVRLCFSNISDADIERGVQILSEALEHSVE